MATNKLIAVLMCCLPVAAMAQTAQREAFGTDDQNNAYYLESDNLTRKGYVVYGWRQVNRAQPDEKNSRFIREKIEFDCNFKKYRTMWITSYSAQDARGGQLNSEAVSNPEWQPANTGTIHRDMLNFACVRVFQPR